jgi:hypothetical protein
MKHMLYDLGVWIVGLVLALPLVALAIACAHTRRFHRSNKTPSRQRAFYWSALALALISNVVYVGYWSWRVVKLYSAEVSFQSSLWLERFMYASVVFTAVTLFLLFIGRGPYRVLVALSVIGIAAYLWLHLPIIHWA